MDEVIRWETPPAAVNPRVGRKRSSRWWPAAEALRGRPGDWAVIYEGEVSGATCIATHIRAGSLMPFAPCGDFEACSRDRNGVRTVYARYLGDGEG